MQKYPKSLIMDYISGTEISEYNIDDLENDVDFMTDVINYSSDKKMYHFS